VLFGAACCASSGAWALNGLNLIGFGVESSAMAGADIAVARDTTALNTNPAGLTQLRRTAFDAYHTAAFALDTAHADRFGNDRKVDNDVVNVGGLGFATPLGTGRFSAGVGLFAQGGAGAVYQDLATPFGGRDELSALFGIARATPGLAWRVTDELSIGLGIPITYARAKQRVFPAISIFNQQDPSQTFFGSIIQDLEATGTGTRFGVRYEATPSLTFAGVYASKVQLELKKGHADVNFGALGLGRVRYRDVRIEGLGLPQEIGLGAAWQASAQTLVSFEIAWLDWSGVLNAQTLTATDPDNPAAPASIRQTLRLDWKDQYVFALGVAHDMNRRTTLYGGLNYGRNPVPERTTSPLLAATGEKHLSAGVRVRLDDGWMLSGAVEYLLPKKVTYNNPELPFGPGAQERTEYVAATLMLGRRW
jgi:long-chain fatty acid transport protein